MNTPTTTETLDQRINRTTARSRPGFSLIELTAVLVIIGLLMAGAAIAVPKYLSRARIKVTKTSMETIRTSINTYMADHSGQPPATISELIPNYLEQKSATDAWEMAYYYNPEGQNNEFVLISAGPDREFQTADDINVWTMDLKSAE